MTLSPPFFAIAQPETIPAPAPALIVDRVGQIGGTTTLPAGRIDLVSPVLIADSIGSTLKGDGPATEVAYAGSPGGSILTITGSSAVTVERLWLKGEAGSPTDAAVKLGRTATDQFAASRVTLRDVWFGSWAGRSDFTNAVLVDSTFDSNNDLHRFETCRFENYGEAGVRVTRNSTQAHSLKFLDCDALGRRVAKNALRWEGKPHFRWTGGSGGFHTESDFYLGDVGANAVVDGWNSEHSQRLLTTGGPSGAHGPIEIRNCRADAIESADGRVIIGKVPGPWTITGNYFAAIGNAALVIDFSEQHNPPTGTVTGNVFVHGRRPTLPVVKLPRVGGTVTVRGNVHVYPGGVIRD